MDEDRIPPGQKPTKKFPVLHCDGVPGIDLSDWDLTVDGAIKNALRLKWEDFLALPFATIVSDFHCVTGWSRLGNKWEGVRFSTLAGMAKPDPLAMSVFMTAEEGYTTSLLLKDMMDDDVLLAYKFDGKPLEAEHGGPLRLVVPKKYAYKAVKWIRRIRFMTEHQLGYWESRGYSDGADPWKEERYSR